MQKKDERLVAISAYLELSLVDAIRRIAAEEDRPLSYVVRQAVVEYIRKRRASRI